MAWKRFRVAIGRGRIEEGRRVQLNDSRNKEEDTAVDESPSLLLDNKVENKATIVV